MKRAAEIKDFRGGDQAKVDGLTGHRGLRTHLVAPADKEIKAFFSPAEATILRVQAIFGPDAEIVFTNGTDPRLSLADRLLDSRPVVAVACSAARAALMITSAACFEREGLVARLQP